MAHSSQDPLFECGYLIAQLARVVVLVEATSGAATIRTVQVALELGREVAAVPGKITEESARGPNRLIGDGATPALETRDVLDLLPTTTAAGSSGRWHGLEPDVFAEAGDEQPRGK